MALLLSLILPSGKLISGQDPQALYRTASVDHSIVMEGETECVLNNRYSKNLRGGDIEVQKGIII